jgi:hypothetical protein
MQKQNIPKKIELPESNFGDDNGWEKGASDPTRHADLT